MPLVDCTVWIGRFTATYQDELDAWFTEANDINSITVHCDEVDPYDPINVVYIWLYTLSCHSCRHAVGGRLRHFSKHPVRYQLWTWVSKLNGNHARYAWVSLFSVALVDLYIYLLASGTIEDVRFF